MPGVRSLNIGQAIQPVEKKLHSNVVITSRYNIFTFLPINLFEQVGHDKNCIWKLVLTRSCSFSVLPTFFI